jgi:beta-galactosidase
LLSTEEGSRDYSTNYRLLMINNKPSFSKILFPGVVLFVLLVECQPKINSDKARSPVVKDNTSYTTGSFFPKTDLMKIGVYYYPEQWAKEEWARDFNNIARYGFEFTHLAEFSWTFLEPKEGVFEFRWLDEAIDLASKAGLKVILCTPTLCPPAWMGNKYPEIYLVGSDGRRREHGIRANASLSNPVYQQYTDKIVTAMADHYAGDTRIWGWQVDNEPLATPDFSPSSKQAFQKWLQQRYGTIDKMNTAWGGSFWSTKYDSFDQVIIPNEAMNEEDKLSPHSVLDFRRFTADVTAGFLNHQADILREHVLPSQWITANYINVSTQADPRRSDHLDFPTFTMYPVSGKNELGGNNFRTGIPYKIYEACDYYRPIKGITGLMELQPGQVNWGSVNPQLLPGTVHMWIMQSFGGGCSFLCTYRYRHPLWSSEMYHEGIVGTDGVTLTQGGREFVQSISEMKILRNEFDSLTKMPEFIAKRRTAILWNHEVMWDLDIQPQTTLWNTWNNRNVYTSAVKSAAAPMDFISEKDDFSKYPFLIAPAYQLIDSVLVMKWRQYVEEGGNLILTSRTGQKDKNGHFFESKLAGPIRSLIGADIEFFDMLPSDMTGTVRYKSSQYIKWNIWAEILSPYEGTEVLASYTDQYYSGAAAVTTRSLGKGTITYIGVSTDSGILERQIVRDTYTKAGVKIEDLPKGVYMEWRDGFFVAVNYTDKDFRLDLSPNSKILFGINPLIPAGALIWKMK